MKNIYLVALSLFLCSISLQSFAQSDDDELFDLSLEELLNVEVVSASKSSEALSKAPAVISVITRKDIESYGALTLQEVLDRVVGAWTYGSLAVPNSIYALRGQNTIIDNYHVLVMIDGRPVRESLRSGQYATFYQSFPLENVKRVEVIRGPGSVLYGSGAYTGVVNIITMAGDELKSSARVRYGSHNNFQVSSGIGKTINDLHIGLGMNYLRGGGWTYEMIDEKGIKDGFVYQKDALAANLTAHYKDFRLSAFVGDITQNVPSNLPVWKYDPRKGADSLSVWEVSTPRLFLNAGYDVSVSDKTDLALDITYNRFRYKNRFPGVGYEEWQKGSSDNLLFEATSFIRPSSNLNIVLGGTASYQSGEFLFYYFNEDRSPRDILQFNTLGTPYEGVPKFNTIWFSLYSQVDYQINNVIKVVGGLQMNKVEDQEASLVPRIGSVLSFSKSWGGKLMVSNAFRAPIGIQTSVKNPGVLWGNPDLTPEKSTTYEAQLFHTTKKSETSLTYYHIRQKNLIGRTLPADSALIVEGVNTPTFVNVGTMDVDGVELESKIKLSQFFSTNIGISYTTSIDNEDQRDYQGTPNTIVKVGLSYSNDRGISVGLFNSYLGDVKPITEFDEEGGPLTQDVNPAATSFNYLTANVTVALKKLLKSEKLPSMSFNLYGTNLLNKEIWNAEYVRRRINSLPAKGGAALHAGLTIDF